VKLWRVAFDRYADLSGVGGLHRPGRWHSVGRPIVYAAEHSALAMLEVRVHLDLTASYVSKFVIMKINVQNDVRVDTIDAEPSDETATRALGDAWLAASLTCICRVKSALAPDAFNYLINPLHPDIGMISLEAAAPMVFDARLFR
jgi:RES domain-containing protein